jgi:hypothetical protein
MLLAAAAVEPDAVDGRMRCAGQALEQPERGQRNVGVLAVWARERVTGRQRVVHRHIVIDNSDGKHQTSFSGSRAYPSLGRRRRPQ